jgi:hypothetical protein
VRAGQILEISDNGAKDYVQTEDGEVPNHEQIQRSRLRVDSRKWPQEVRRQGGGSVIRPRQTLCQASAIWSSKSAPFTRCKSHGGMSTGPETAEGIECIRQAVTKHGTPDRPKAAAASFR